MLNKYRKPSTKRIVVFRCKARFRQPSVLHLQLAKTIQIIRSPAPTTQLFIPRGMAIHEPETSSKCCSFKSTQIRQNKISTRRDLQVI